MTTPVSIYYEPGDGPNCENKWTEAFYVPQIHQEDPPTGPEIFIEERPEMVVLTRWAFCFDDNDHFFHGSIKNMTFVWPLRGSDWAKWSK